jgi:hypothetical protein
MENGGLLPVEPCGSRIRTTKVRGVEKLHPTLLTANQSQPGLHALLQAKLIQVG